MSWNKRVSKRQDPAHAKSREIDQQLISDFKKRSEYKTILLLGTGESGKTTIIKQMKIIHINGFDEKEKLEKARDIRHNIHEAIYSIVSNLEKISPPILLQRKEIREAAEYIVNFGETPQETYSQEYYDVVETLWRDDDIQRMFKRAHEYHLLDSTEEFMNRLDEIRKPDYLPTTQDILYCRVKTTAITNILFDVPVPKKYGGGVAKFSMFDVGGQRGHRRKWISVFEGISTVLFVISVSDFDQTLREDEKTNRLEESLTVFENMFGSRYLRTSNVIIFLNKEDILEKKIYGGTSIGTYFDRYNTFKQAPDEFTNTKLFIKQEITKRTEDNSKHTKQDKRGIFIHFTVATSTQNIKHIFDSIHESIIEKAIGDFVPL